MFLQAMHVTKNIVNSKHYKLIFDQGKMRICLRYHNFQNNNGVLKQIDF